jgi:predicted hydrocarbon binding protein
MSLDQEYSPFALSLLRDQLLPNLLGEETDEILYWAGKELARKQPMNDENEISSYFQTYGLGELVMDELKKNRRRYVLKGSLIAHRISENKRASFSLETGFLAEQIQRISGMLTEGSYEVKVKKQEVHITLQSDPKEELPY